MQKITYINALRVKISGYNLRMKTATLLIILTLLAITNVRAEAVKISGCTSQVSSNQVLLGELLDDNQSVIAVLMAHSVFETTLTSLERSHRYSFLSELKDIQKYTVNDSGCLHGIKTIFWGDIESFKLEKFLAKGGDAWMR